MQIELATAAVHFGTALKYRRNWNKKNAGVQVIESFNKGKGKKASQRYRLYIPIHDARTPVKVPHAIQRAVESAGYVISDYIGGFATQKDGKRVMKIGKLLKDEGLRNAFANDENRQAHKNGYTCVISCHPYDIIGMSTGRTWDQFSCMRLGAGAKLNKESNNGEDGAYADTIDKDIAEGTLVAYAIKNGDDNISKPDARLLIKPYVNARKEVLFRVETKVYGNPVRGFREQITQWLRKVNANCSAGTYSLVKGLYNDGAGYNASHMGPLAFADLNDPAALKQWVEAAKIGDFSEQFLHGDNAVIKAILTMSDELYKEYMFNDLVKDILHEEVELPEAKERLEIMVRHILGMGKDGKEQLNRLMVQFLVRWTPLALNEDTRRMLAPILKYNPERNYSHAFKVWGLRFNPSLIMQPNGDTDEEYDRYIRVGDLYPWLEPLALDAPRKSKLYKVAALESFVQFAHAAMNDKQTEWKPISPSVVPSDDFVKYNMKDSIDAMKWNDDQKLFAFAVNSMDWFSQDNASLIGLYYMEHLTVAALFENPYIKYLYNNGVKDDEHHKDIANTFADIVERTCRSDKAGVKPEETRMFELAELLGEHDYNIKRGIEREVERALYD